MKLAGEAAIGLIDARHHRGPACAFERVIETGMVVTYARPYLPTNYAGIVDGPDDRTWWPQDEDDQALHVELIDLRHQHHAHADHVTQRQLDLSPAFATDDPPELEELWSAYGGGRDFSASGELHE
jgi:hypothetical protein